MFMRYHLTPVKIYILILTIIIISLVSSIRMNATTKPIIRILPDTTLDLGTIVQGQKGYGAVTIKNIGDDTLRLQRVKASCGCTAALVKDDDLAPSDSTVLSITFDSGKMEGLVEKEVSITSNDPDQPKVIVRFRANVITILKADPHAFIFLKCAKESSYTKTITLTNPSSEHTIHILSIDPKSNSLRVTAATPVLKPGESTQLTGTFQAIEQGFSRISIIVSIDHPLQKQFEIIATAWVK
jgi:hypothetical protein